ncbi:UPF0715 family protein [Priestia endophytica]|uniref:Uncharacterized protein n=1 Tax=Priestia endophytica TaxID=135735 RepID=A0AAX1Q4M9_9BACI|nr:UPF0715 family protein [Priestia endophytica]RAS74458.1 hypothetical protein A3864_18585 [Priestia endophytica]
MGAFKALSPYVNRLYRHYRTYLFIYLFTAFPLSLLLNKKKKQFSILDLILYIIGSFLIILFIKLKLANVQWEGFNDLAWMEYVIWIGSAIFYWIWNSIFVLRN